MLNLNLPTNGAGGQILDALAYTPDLYAAYQFGTESGRDDPLQDWSNNGRDLVQYGSPEIGTDHAVTQYANSVRNFFECPFTGEELAAVTGVVMVLAIFYPVNATDFGWLFGNYNPDTAVDYYGLASQDAATDRIAFAGSRRAGGEHSQAPISVDARYGGEWLAIAGVWSSTRTRAYAMYAGRTTLLTASDVVSPELPPFGPGKMRIGGAFGAPAAAYNDPLRIHRINIWTPASLPDPTTYVLPRFEEAAAFAEPYGIDVSFGDA